MSEDEMIINQVDLLLDRKYLSSLEALNSKQFGVQEKASLVNDLTGLMFIKAKALKDLKNVNQAFDAILSKQSNFTESKDRQI